MRAGEDDLGKERAPLCKGRDRRAEQVHAAVAVERIDRRAGAGEIAEAAPRARFACDEEAAMRRALTAGEAIDRRGDQRDACPQRGDIGIAAGLAEDQLGVAPKSVQIGLARKAARLRYLRDRWAHRLAQNPKCKTLHSEDAAQSCGIGFLAFNGVDAGKMRETLFSKYNIISAYVPHEEFTGLRITPHIYSTLQDFDAFSAAVEREVG